MSVVLSPSTVISVISFEKYKKIRNEYFTYTCDCIKTTTYCTTTSFSRKNTKIKNSIKVYWFFTSIGHELHSRLNNFHPRYLKTFLAFMQASQHRRIFSFSNEKWESSQITSEVVFELILWSLPTGSNAQGSINPFSRMEWPVINHLWITFILLERLSINIKLYIWEDRWNSIVMPFIITNLQNT